MLTVEVLAYITKKLGVEADNNPDFIHERYETLTIDNVRAIRDTHAGMKFSADAPRIFLLEIFGATREAQNGLLKILEEPHEGNHFFLVVPSIDILLPTVRSRMQIIRGNSVNPSDADSSGGDIHVAGVSARDFLKSSIKDRLSTVVALTTSIQDEEASKHEAVDFLNSLERYIYDTSHAEKTGKADTGSNNSGMFNPTTLEAFGAIDRARSYMNDRAPSIKMLLEYVALSV